MDSSSFSPHWTVNHTPRRCASLAASIPSNDARYHDAQDSLNAQTTVAAGSAPTVSATARPVWPPSTYRSKNSTRSAGASRALRRRQPTQLFGVGGKLVGRANQALVASPAVGVG